MISPRAASGARFVGLDAYEAAGGSVVRDLFSDAETGTWLADPELLQRLAAERMQAEADALTTEGWAWVETSESFSYSSFHNFGRVYPGPLPLADEDRAELDRLTGRRDAILSSLEASGGDSQAEALATLETAISALRRRAYGYTAEDMARSGCAVGLTHEGKVKVERGLIRPEDVKREKREARAVAIAVKIEGGATITEAPFPALSDALVEALTAQRTAALRVEVMQRPELALAGVVHALALPVFYAHAYRAASCFELRASDVGLTHRTLQAGPARP